MNSLPNSRPERPLLGTLAFAASIAITLFMTLFLVVSLARVVAPAHVSLSDRVGRTAGGLFGTIVTAGVGYGFAALLFSAGMASRFPRTHSRLGKLQQIFDATENVDVERTSYTGYYSNASEMELMNFYRVLVKKPDSDRFADLVLEVRRRLAIDK